jgi:hypothetical protein
MFHVVFSGGSKGRDRRIYFDIYIPSFLFIPPPCPWCRVEDLSGIMASPPPLRRALFINKSDGIYDCYDIFFTRSSSSCLCRLNSNDIIRIIVTIVLKLFFTKLEIITVHTSFPPLLFRILHLYFISYVFVCKRYCMYTLVCARVHACYCMCVLTCLVRHLIIILTYTVCFPGNSMTISWIRSRPLLPS